MAAPPKTARPAVPEPRVDAPARETAMLRGEPRCGDEGTYFVVETQISSDTTYARGPVGSVGERLHACATDALFFAAAARSPFLFFDIETTGLAGGAGTLVFLVGCGEFAADNTFVTRQFLLTRPDEERPLLGAVRSELDRAGALVSFNGKSFDAPILETRYLFHRLEWTGAAVPHIDVLHPARRLWANRECSLAALEAEVLGERRSYDVPGVEAPARYFRYLRTGDASPLAAVLEHNRRDLLALAALTTKVLELVRDGAAAARDAQEALALGAIYSRAGLDGRARAAFHRALDMAESKDGRRSACFADAVGLAALRALAMLSRRGRRHNESAAYWQRLLDVGGCPAHVAREATEALAIHHEHRVRDLEAARTFALRSLGTGTGRAWGEAVRHRLARIDRKLSASALPLLFPLPPCPSSPSRPFLPSSGSPTSVRRTSS